MHIIGIYIISKLILAGGTQDKIHTMKYLIFATIILIISYFCLSPYKLFKYLFETIVLSDINDLRWDNEVCCEGYNQWYSVEEEDFADIF